MELTKQAKRELRNRNRTDRQNLFNAVWRKILAFNRAAEIDDLPGLYDTIASELVNNSRSRFYIYG